MQKSDQTSCYLYLREKHRHLIIAWQISIKRQNSNEILFLNSFIRDMTNQIPQHEWYHNINT